MDTESSLGLWVIKGSLSVVVCRKALEKLKISSYTKNVFLKMPIYKNYEFFE